VFNQDVVSAVRQHFWLLLLVPLTIGLAAYGLAGLAPSAYTSTAYLHVDGAVTKSAQTLMHSSFIAEQVLSKLPGTGGTPEAHIRFLKRNLHIVDLSPDIDQKMGRYVRVEVSASDPRTAQSITSGLIDAWLDTTKPKAVEQAGLEAELARAKNEAASDSALIDRLQKEATNLIMPSSREGEIATPISNLISKRDRELASVTEIQNRLDGVSRDVIVSAPDLPIETSWPNESAVAILSAIAAVPVLLALILLGRYLRRTEGGQGAASRRLAPWRKKSR
jgi:hypothetical protein